MLAIAVVLLLTDRLVLRRDALDAAAPPAKSIAILPFDDLSPGHDHGYFSAGLAEELLNALAKVHGEGKARTGDLSGSATTREFTDAVIAAL